jgi:acetyltransferase-like isoleucine patch superfamily enzyme
MRQFGRRRRGRTGAGMTDYRKLFKSCGANVEIAADAYFEHPEVIEVGDNVKFMRGFFMGLGKPGVCTIGSDVTFYPNCFIQGSAGRFIIEDHVEFFPGTYVSLGAERSFIEIGHHSHFAPNCVLYGWGGLKIGPYCNIAAHCVFATVGHDPGVKDKPMALAGAKSGPITLVEDVWVAANVTITANTTIAKGCVIGANAVVTRDTEPNGLYVGVPARRLRDR